MQLSNAEYHLPATDIHRLIRAAPCHRDAVLVRLLAETGLRRSEVVQLRTADIDSARRLLTVRSGKNGKLRVVPISPLLAEMLGTLVAAASPDYLFRTERGGHLGIRQLNRVVAAIGVRAGVRSANPRRSSVTPHLLRHSFARLWKQSGGSIESLAIILGHASVKTTLDLYGREGLEDIRRNYDATLPRLFSETQSGSSSEQTEPCAPTPTPGSVNNSEEVSATQND